MIASSRFGIASIANAVLGARGAAASGATAAPTRAALNAGSKSLFASFTAHARAASSASGVGLTGVRRTAASSSSSSIVSPLWRAAFRRGARQRSQFATRRQVLEGEVVEMPWQSRAAREMNPKTKMRLSLIAAAGMIGIGTIAFGGKMAQADTSGATMDSNELMGDAAEYAGDYATAGAAKSSASAQFPTLVRERLSATYASFAAGVATTAATAVIAFRSPQVMRFAAARPTAFMIGGALVGFASLIGTHMVDYSQSPGLKTGLYIAFTAAQGVTLAPIGILGGAIVMQAAMGTGLLIGSLSLVASVAPSESFLWMGGPLTIGLGVVVLSSLGSMFFPGSSLLMNVSLYGGLALFSGMQLYDVQRIAQRAKATPADVTWDPISTCTGIYLNTLNIFIRLVTILSGGGGNRRRR